QADGIESILAAIRLRQLDPGNLGDRVPFIRRLQRAGQKAIFPNRLFGELRINARRTEEQQLLRSVSPCRIDNIRSNKQVVLKKVDRGRAVGQDSADTGGGQKNEFRPLMLKKTVNGGCVAKIHF